MIDIFSMSATVLGEVGFATSRIATGERAALAFEDSTVLGFLFGYANPGELLRSWSSDSSRVITDHQLGLRRAGQKAWNTYVVLLSAERADYPGLVALAAIEEDLSGTRKIARSGVQSESELRAALLTLLPIQSAPKLEAVDLATEIRQRTTELPPRAIDAFVSSAEASVVLQVLEQGQ